MRELSNHCKVKYAALAALALFAVLSGCSCRRGETEKEYHVFSGGEILDSGVIVSSPDDSSAAEFYIPEGMTLNYYSTYSLNDEEKELYAETVEYLGRLEPVAPMPVDAIVYRKILEIVRLEQLSFSHVTKWKNEYSAARQRFEVIFDYRLSAEEITSMNIAAERAAKKIISMLPPETDDYEKLKFFHDYLILNCETDVSDEYADTVYGALVKGKALCEGYTKAFAYLCNLAGIENAIVTGETTVAHMWNMVKLNGNWYHVDVTWDKPEDSLHRHYPDVILYQYFMVTDAVIKNNHTIWTNFAEPPKAYGTDENYFVREGADISSADELLTASENAITAAANNGKRSAMIKFATTDLYLSSLADLSDETLFHPVRERVKADYGANLAWTDFYGKYRIITFILSYDNE